MCTVWGAALCISKTGHKQRLRENLHEFATALIFRFGKEVEVKIFVFHKGFDGSAINTRLIFAVQMTDLRYML